MEPRDPLPRVRPLPPDGEEHPAASRVTAPGRIFAIAAGSLVIALMVVVFGAGGDEEATLPEPGESLAAVDAGDLEVTTTTLPQRLVDALPIEMERLSAVVGADDARMILWNPSERFARSYRLPFAPHEVWFDADGTSVAFVDKRSALFVGPSPGDAAVGIEATATAARFHPADAGELAYTAALADPNMIGLYRTLAAPGLLGGIEPTLIAQVPGTGRLLTWGDWGYALAIDEPAAILILDPDGRPERVMAGTAYTAGGDAILVDSTGPAPDDPGVLDVLAPDVVNSEPIVGIIDTEFEPIFLFPGIDAASSNVTISADGSRIAVTTFTNTGGTSITIRDRAESTLRTIRMDFMAQPIGFVAAGTHLALQDLEGGELVVADWRTGVHHRVPALSGNFLAVDL